MTLIIGDQLRNILALQNNDAPANQLLCRSKDGIGFVQNVGKPDCIAVYSSIFAQLADQEGPDPLGIFIDAIQSAYFGLTEPCAFKNQLFERYGEVGQKVTGGLIQNQIGTRIPRFFKANRFAGVSQEVFDIEITGTGKGAEELGGIVFTKLLQQVSELDNRCFNSLIPFELSAL